MTITEYLEKHPMTINHQRAPENPHMEDGGKKMFNYFCALSSLTVSARPLPTPFTLYFSKGAAHVKGTRKYIGGRWIDPAPIPPTVAEVLECLALDFSTVNGSTFTQWAGDLGYDTDSISARKTYDLIQNQAQQFARVFGHTAYADLLEVRED